MKNLMKCGLYLFVFAPLMSVGQNWEGLGAGITATLQEPREMFSYNDELIVSVQTSQGFDNPVFVWDGMEWSNPYDWCDGVGGAPHSLLEYEDGIAVAGCGVGLYSNNQWQTLAIAATRGLGVYQGDLIAVGWFDTIAGIAASKVARWDGTAWSAIDTTVWEGGAISSVIEYQGDLYVGGNMIDGELDIDRIGRWDGTKWNKVGDGFRNGGVVSCFQIFEGDLYMGGSFGLQQGGLGPHIARWDGHQWKDVGGAIHGWNGNGCSVRDMVVYEDELYAVGVCSYAGGVLAERIAKWDGAEWCGFGDSFNNSLTAIEVHQGELYIGGGFTIINDDTIYRVAKWVGGDFVDQCGTLSSIEDNEAEPAQLTVFPNPTATTLTITWPQLTSGTPHLRMYDAQGRQVNPQTSLSAKGQLEVNMRGLAPGIYFGQLQVGNEVHGFKVVRE